MKKAILVGLGGRSRHWLANCREHPNVEIVGYVETAEASIVRAVDKWDVPAKQIHDSVTAAAAATDADFVVDVTPRRRCTKQSP